MHSILVHLAKLNFNDEGTEYLSDRSLCRARTGELLQSATLCRVADCLLLFEKGLKVRTLAFDRLWRTFILEGCPRLGDSGSEDLAYQHTGLLFCVVGRRHMCADKNMLKEISQPSSFGRGHDHCLISNPKVNA